MTIAPGQPASASDVLALVSAYLPLTGGTVSGPLSVGSTINLGTSVGSGGNVVIQTPNGSNIVLNPQGAGQVLVNANLEAFSLTFDQPRTWVSTDVTKQALLNYNSTWGGTNPSSNPTALFGLLQADIGVASTGGADIYGLFSTIDSNSAATVGNIVGINSRVVISHATGNGSSFPGATYNAGTFEIDFLANDNGSSGTAVGLATPLNTVMHWGPNATHTAGGGGAEFDICAEAGSSMLDKIGLLLTCVTVGGQVDAVQGSRDDIMLALDGGTTSVGFRTLIGVGRSGGFNPLSSAGWVMDFTANGGSGTIGGAGGFDFTNFVPSDSFFKGSNFKLDPSGIMTAASYKVGGHQVVGAQIAGWGTSSNGSRGAVNGSTATLPQVAAALAQLLVDLESHGLVGA